jgi:cytosine deaminase
MHIEDVYGIEAGKPADLVILDSESDYETLRLIPECLYVIRKGKVLASAVPARRTLTIGGREEQVDFKF